MAISVSFVDKKYIGIVFKADRKQRDELFCCTSILVSRSSSSGFVFYLTSLYATIYSVERWYDWRIMNLKKFGNGRALIEMVTQNLVGD
jgi:hypothetical protein